MRERRKSILKFDAAKVYNPKKVRIFFCLARKLHFLQFGFQKHLANFFCITYRNGEWCQFMVRIGSPEFISFYHVCFLSFFFSVFFSNFLWILILVEVLRYIWRYLKQPSGVIPRWSFEE